MGSLDRGEELLEEVRGDVSRCVNADSREGELGGEPGTPVYEGGEHGGVGEVVVREH